MSSCGTCPSCSVGVPVCVGNVCVAPEEALVGGSFIFATFATLFNFFVARREAVKKTMSNNTRMFVFVAIPVVIFAICVQLGHIEIPTGKAIYNSLFGVEGPEIHHGHSHGHAEWHGDHIGHFHHEVADHAHEHDHHDHANHSHEHGHHHDGVKCEHDH